MDDRISSSGGLGSPDSPPRLFPEVPGWTAKYVVRFGLASNSATETSAGARAWVNTLEADLVVLPHFSRVTVMTEQCGSGWFIGPSLKPLLTVGAHVATAVNRSGYSLGGKDFDPFAESGERRPGLTDVRCPTSPRGLCVRVRIRKRAGGSVSITSIRV